VYQLTNDAYFVLVQHAITTTDQLATKDASPAQHVSGLKYDALSNSITYNSESITHNNPRFDLQSSTPPHFCRQPSDYTNDRIQAAFSHVERSGKVDNKDSFLKLIQKLDKEMVGSAMDWVSSPAVNNLEYESFGEMFLQQIVYSPFAALFVAAAKGHGCYAADQEVASSLSVLGRTNRSSWSAKSITIKPDSAVTLGKKRDALGMMEIKADVSNSAAHKVDKDRCVLVTAATARVLYRLDRDSYEKVVLPFVIANGTSSGLFVTRLYEDGTPYVSYIRLDAGDGPIYSCQQLPDLVRSEMFVALAVILDDLCSFLDDAQMLPKYLATFRTAFFSSVKLFSGTTPKKRKPDPEGGDDADGPSQETDAMGAVSYNGAIVALRCAFLHTLRFGDESDEEEERLPPFFFIGTEAATRQAVFVKVWPFSKATLVDVQTEWALQNQAHAAGVSVARPLGPEVIQVHSSITGTLYMMIVMEYIPMECIDQNIETLMAFVVSLISTVHQLHSTALVLHCDLSAANVIWNGERVVLVDFGRAQPIHKAYSERGTKGFEAPELLDGKPHGPGTDAFSVGRIILFWLGELGANNRIDEDGVGEAKAGLQQQYGLFRLLNVVAIGLTKVDPSERWDLEQALCELTNVRLESDHKALPSPPPCKIAKYAGSNPLGLEQAAQ
jgi:Protein kinase domain